MSSDYNAYIGVYLKLERTQINTAKIRHECSKCGIVYTNGAKFCGNCGAEVVDKQYSETCTIKSYSHLGRLYPALEEYPMCDKFYTPEYLCDDTHFICKPDGGGDSYCESTTWKSITPMKISLSLEEFKLEYSTELSLLDSLGIKYELEYGFLGYWS
jgi:hypothetical protein